MSIEKVSNGMRFWATVCALVLGGLCLSGCRSGSPGQQYAEVPGGLTTGSGANPAPSAAVTAAATAAAAATTSPATTSVSTAPAAVAASNSVGPEPDVLHVGDSLTVTFTDTATVIPTFEEKIKEDGTITLTLNKTFKADGRTRGQLEKDIRDCYVPDYFKQMTVTVKHDVSTRWYYVYGEVHSANRQIYNSRLTLTKAIASAGGFTDFANKKTVQLTRADGRTQTVNCVKAQGNAKLDPEVYPGDTILVHRKLW